MDIQVVRAIALLILLAILAGSLIGWYARSVVSGWVDDLSDTGDYGDRPG